jgi:hypothetical protein
MSKPGSQMGQKAKAVLECLRKNGPMNRLDLERVLAIAPLATPINGLLGRGYINNGAGKYVITRDGRVALGESLAITSIGPIRYCNSTTEGLYVPGLHNISNRILSL